MKGKSVIFIAALALLILLMTWPVFNLYFFAENFWSLGIYYRNKGDLLATIFGPVGPFFRPFYVAVTLFWHAVLPLEPLAYHIRNYIFVVVNVWLLYKLIIRLVPDRKAAMLATSFFAVNKVHLTLIGFINTYESTVLLALLLLTLLFALRFAEQKRRLDYLIMMLCASLSIFSKDQGFVVVIVLVALIISKNTGIPYREWAVRLSPLLLVVGLYFFMRYRANITMAPAPAYVPHLSFDLIGRNALAFVAMLGNMTLTWVGTFGANPIEDDRVIYTACVALFLLVAWTLWIGRRIGSPLILPLVWIAIYLGPPSLIEWHYIYYFYEALAGATLLLAMCLSRGSGKLKVAWSVAILIACVNGFVSSHKPVYAWQYISEHAEKVKPVIEQCKTANVQSVTFVCSKESYTLHVFSIGTYAMIGELCGKPYLPVKVLDFEQAAVEGVSHSPDHFVLNADAGFAPYITAHSSYVPMSRQFRSNRGIYNARSPRR